MNLQLRIHTIRKYGIDMSVGLLVDPVTGLALTSVVRWSEMQARRDVSAWAAVRGFRVDESAPARTRPGVASAAQPTPQR